MNQTEILPSISSPADLKKLNEGQIGQLCGEIRNRIIETTSENGGHVGPNLGVVELTVALHLVFDTPKDSFFWDVSHQGYVHKLLTGRNDKRFDKIRQSEGLSGFLSRDESQHDAFGAGHAGTALSAALGRCMARDLEGRNEHVVAVAGDAAFTCGITLEALNNIACSTRKFILVLNDNEWSIARTPEPSPNISTNSLPTRLQQAPQRRRQVPLPSPRWRILEKVFIQSQKGHQGIIGPLEYI